MSARARPSPIARWRFYWRDEDAERTTEETTDATGELSGARGRVRPAEPALVVGSDLVAVLVRPTGNAIGEFDGAATAAESPRLATDDAPAAGEADQLHSRDHQADQSADVY